MVKAPGPDQQALLKETLTCNETYPQDSQANGSCVMKVTQQGWEHPVYLVLDKSTASIRWGQSERNLTKQLMLRAVTEISLNYMNGTFVLIPKTRTRRFYFKTADVNLAKDWMLRLQMSVDNNLTYT